MKVEQLRVTGRSTSSPLFLLALSLVCSGSLLVARESSALNKVPNSIVVTNYEVDETIEVSGMQENMIGRYYYPARGEDLGVVVIAHADGKTHLQYDDLATSLAQSGVFVASIDRTILDNLDDGVLQYYDLLQHHLKYLFKELNNETLSTTQFPFKDPESPTVLSHKVMLVGHSAGGRATFYRGKSAVNDLMGLDLKAIVGIAPTLGPLDGAYPDLDDLPAFILQGNADTDNIFAPGTEEIHFDYSNVARAKVGLLEQPNGSERAYILVSGPHAIQDSNDVVAYIRFISKAFLKNDRGSFDQYIRFQSTPYVNPATGFETYSNILYWNDGDHKVFRALTGFIPVGWNFSTLIVNKLETTKAPAQTLLGTPDATKTLHFSKALKVVEYTSQDPSSKGVRTLKFLFNQPVADASYLRFNAGQLFKYETESYSSEGINALIRLHYDGGGTSEWRLLSEICGAITSAELVFIDRNIMKTYVIPLDAFAAGPVGAAVSGVEFDLTDVLHRKRLMLDDMAFME